MAEATMVGKTFVPKKVVSFSGIYECTLCSQRFTFTKGLRFPPSHCLNAKWRLVVALPDAEAPKFEETLKNLLAAYVGESNAYVRYAAFAGKADEEGYLKLGSLFRATSRAEQIHASNHAEVIQVLGGMPDPKIIPPEVMTTEDNLEVALSGENYEVNTMYADFIKEAEESKFPDALHTFNLAIEVEKKHARLFSAAIVQLRLDRSGEKLSAKASYYVCPKCGYTVEHITFDECPNCGSWAKRYQTVD